MSRGQHAADDGSFPRSAGGAMARGIGLIVIAVVLGVVLLRSTDGTDVVSAGTGDEVIEGGTETTEGTDTTEGTGDSGTTTTTAPPAHAPNEVQVLVANGTGGVQGAARTISDRIKAANYVMKQPTNTRAAAQASVVYFMPGYQADAQAIAALLDPKPSVQPMPEQRPVADLANAHILVVVAADLVSN